MESTRNMTRELTGNIPFRFIPILLTLAALQAGGSLALGAETIDDHDKEESGREDGLIHLGAGQLDDFEVRLEVAGPVDLALGTLLPGEVKLNQERMAHVSPRYDGIVTGILARLGETVRTGQDLATLESNDTLAPFRVSSPIDGTIVDFHITMGESVEAGRYLFIVADLTEVWVDLDIYQKDLGRVEKGQPVMVMAGRDELRAEGRIDYVGPVVRESTRTGLARVTLDNPDGRWRAGMFVTGRVTTEAPTVPVAIRHSAVQKLEGRPVAFVKTGDGFEPRDLVLGRRDLDSVEVLSGLSPGETYVSERSFLLKAQLEKSSLDPHAGHAH